MFRKHFRLIIVLLAIIVIVESGYILSKKLDGLRSILFGSDIQSNEVKSQNGNIGFGKVSPINIAYLNYIRSLKRDVIVSAIVVLVCRGTIEEIYSKPWVDNTIRNSKFELGFKLKDSPYDCKYLRYDKLSLPNLQYYELVNGKKTKIDFKDFTVGDKIITRTEIDLLRPIDMKNSSNLIKTEIFKVQK